jgi:predicted RNA-binding Zn-ribbon protein involved in translation (DUF1610 family)
MAIPTNRTIVGSGKISLRVLMPLGINSNHVAKEEEGNMRISCPNCGSLLIYRSRKKGILEHVLSKIIFVHPFRCEGCDTRFFRWSVHEKPIPPRPMPTS